MSNGAGALLEILRRQPEASRSELAERTGLARSTVGQRLELLSALGYVEEAGPRPSTGGRPASTVRFKPDGGVILACDLGATHCRLAVTDLNRRVLAAVSHELPIADGPEPVLGRVRTLLLALLRRARRAPAQVRAIGVGLPGPVEFASGRPVNPPIMPGWDGVDVPRLLSGLRRAGAGRQRRQHHGARRAPRALAELRRLPLHQGRDRHRLRDHHRRPDAPRRAGRGRRHRPHTASPTPTSCAAAATAAASRRSPPAARWRGGSRRRGSRSTTRARSSRRPSAASRQRSRRSATAAARSARRWRGWSTSSTRRRS